MNPDPDSTPHGAWPPDPVYDDLGFPSCPWPPSADPFDEDGYCEFCGNGRWRFHAPWCAWADLRDWLEALA